MADMMSILAANYKTVGTTIPTKTPYVAVDPALYEGSWTGKYANQKTFKITVSNVTGFRAKVQYQSERHQQISGSADQGQCVQGRRHEVHAHGKQYGAGQERRHRRRQRADLPRSGLREAFLSGGAKFRAPTRHPPFLRSTKNPMMAQALRSVARRRCGASLVRSSAWK